MILSLKVTACLIAAGERCVQVELWLRGMIKAPSKFVLGPLLVQAWGDRHTRPQVFDDDFVRLHNLVGDVQERHEYTVVGDKPPQEGSRGR